MPVNTIRTKSERAIKAFLKGKPPRHELNLGLCVLVGFSEMVIDRISDAERKRFVAPDKETVVWSPRGNGVSKPLKYWEFELELKAAVEAFLAGNPTTAEAIEASQGLCNLANALNLAAIACETKRD